LCLSSARTDKKFGWQQITSGDANKEAEIMKFQNNNNDKNILQETFFRFLRRTEQKRAGGDPGSQVLTASPCNKEFTTKAVEEQRSADCLTALYRELPGVQSSSLRRCMLGTICNNEEDFSFFQFHALQFIYYNFSQHMHTIRVTVTL
jgi:hypothetical protein